jgi:hypothetical protein
MDQEEMVESLINLKYLDRVLLKNRKYFLNDRLSIYLKEPIEVVLPFKVEDFEDVSAFHNQNHFIAGFDCYHLVDIV